MTRVETLAASGSDNPCLLYRVVIFSELSASEEDFPKHQVLWDRCIWCAVCLLSALRCLERTNRAGRLLLSVYREKSVGMRETEVKLNWDIKRIFYSLDFRDVQYGLTWSWFFLSYPLWDDWDVNDNYWRFVSESDGLKQTHLQHEFCIVRELLVLCSG